MAVSWLRDLEMSLVNHDSTDAGGLEILGQDTYSQALGPVNSPPVLVEVFEPFRVLYQVMYFCIIV